MSPDPTNLNLLHHEFVTVCCHELDRGLRRIEHCLDQLTDEDVWWRPRDEMNSIGNLMLHVCGNLRQWIVAGVGGGADTRARPKEFAERGPIPKAELARDLRGTIEAAKSALWRSSGVDMLRVRHVQHLDATGLRAALNSVGHFLGHAQEIIHITRTRCGGAYRLIGIGATSD